MKMLIDIDEKVITDMNNGCTRLTDIAEAVKNGRLIRDKQNHIVIDRKVEHGRSKAVGITIYTEDFDTIYEGELTLENFALLLTGCEVKIERKE